MSSTMWKPLKWLLIGLLALFMALWVGSGYRPVQADDAHQDIFKIGSDLVIAESQTVDNAFTIGGDLVLRPNVTIDGDVFAIGGTVELQENARIRGDTLTIGGQIIRDEGAVIDGDELIVLEGARGLFERFGVLGTLYLFNAVIWFLTFVVAAIAGLLLLLLLPGHVDAIAAAVHDRPLTSLVYGIGGVTALTILTVLTGGSALGAIAIPLANLVALLTALLGCISVCVWLGKQLQKRQPDAHFRHFWLGLLLLFIVSLIPAVGGLLVSLFALFGFGATILVRYGTRHAADTSITLDRFEHQPE